MLLKEQQHYSIHFYSLLLFSFLIPIHPRLAIPFIVIVTLNWLVSGQFKSKLKRFFNPLAIIFSSVYFIHLIGLLYSTNLREGFSDVETKLTLFLFPLLLFTVPFKDYLHEKRQLLKAFIGGCFVASIYCLSCSTYVYFTTGANTFAYTGLSGFLHSHPGYQALYMALAFFTLIHYEVFTDEKSLFSKTINLMLGSFFLVMVFLFTSRTVVIANILLLLLTIFYVFNKKLGALKAIGIATFTGLILIGSLWLHPHSQKRILQTIESFQEERSEGVHPPIRIEIWNTSLKAIKINPIIGIGTGDIQDQLFSLYKQNNITKAMGRNLNAHNQFLQTTIALGAIGVIILLLNFVVPMILGFKSGDYLLLMFLFLFFIFSMTESSLEKQQGVLFYAFFNSVLGIGRTLGGRGLPPSSQ